MSARLVGSFSILFIIAYSVVIVQQVLLGVIAALLLSSLYFVWRFFVAIEAIADAQQRLAARAEADDGQRLDP